MVCQKGWCFRSSDPKNSSNQISMFQLWENLKKYQEGIWCDKPPTHASTHRAVGTASGACGTPGARASPEVLGGEPWVSSKGMTFKVQSKDLPGHKTTSSIGRFTTSYVTYVLRRYCLVATQLLLFGNDDPTYSFFRGEPSHQAAPYLMQSSWLP